MLRVVAVDDEPPALTELVYLLRGDPRISDVVGLSSTTDALRHIHRVLATGEAPHAVFLDVHMPGLDGLDMARLRRDPDHRADPRGPDRRRGRPAVDVTPLTQWARA